MMPAEEEVEAKYYLLVTFQLERLRIRRQLAQAEQAALALTEVQVQTQE
jgi:hypothetical protein